MSAWLDRKRKRRREIYAQREEEHKENISRKRFTEPERGGKPPEYFALEPSVLEKFHHFMNGRFRSVIRYSSDVFFDNSSLGIFNMPILNLTRENVTRFGTLYYEMIPYAEISGYRENIEKLIELTEMYTGFFLKLFREKSTIILSDIVGEFDEYWKNLRTEAKQHIASVNLRNRIFDVVRELWNAARQNNEKHRDIEEDPLIERIMNVLPVNSDISEVDRRLLSTVIANGACDGKRKGIITGDRHINQLTSALYNGVRNGNAVLDVGDLAESIHDFSAFDLGIHHIRLYTREYTGYDTYCIRTFDYFDILNSKK